MRQSELLDIDCSIRGYYAHVYMYVNVHYGMYMYVHVTTREVHVHVFGCEKDPEFVTLYIVSVFASEAEAF